MFLSCLWNPPRLTLDFDPELLTVVALATEGRLSSAGNPMLSSLPLPGRKPGESAISSDESLKKLPLPKTLDVITAPFVLAHEGGVGEVAVGGLRDMEGILPPDVSSTASCFR